MKILFIDTEPVRRGAQVFISELSSFLDKVGEETKIIYLYQPANGLGELISFSDKAIVLKGHKNSFSEKLPGMHPALVDKLLREIQAFSPDVILSNGSRTLKYSAVARQFYKGNSKWIARWIDDAAFWNPGSASKWVYSKLIMSQFNAVIGVSQASLDSMIRHYNFQKPSAVIHRVFNPNKFRNAPSREEARKQLGLRETDEVLLFLGNLTKQKRPDRFIEVVQKLGRARPHLKALIVGDGPMKNDLENSCHAAKYHVSSLFAEDRDEYSQISGLRSSVLFIGSQQDVSPYLSAADILTLTSDTEGLPGVVLETAHFEVPCVATEVGGIAECLIDGETGFLIPDRSVDSFCQKINLLFDNPYLRNRFGQNAKKFTSQHYRIERVAQQYLDFFQSL